jgi:hypothetical protein
LRAGTRAHALRYARHCYDHLAGRLGVAVADALFVPGGDSLELTEAGAARLAAIDVDAASGERARACLDWTEQRHHAAGRLGRLLLERLLELEWLQRSPSTRALRVTDAGRAALEAELGVRIT